MIGDVMFPLSKGGGGGGGGSTQYKGTVSQASELPSSPNNGDMYISTGTFTVDGQQVNPKDYIIWNAETDQWDVISGGVSDGITGPSSAVNGNIVVFDGTSGKVVKDSGFNPTIFIAYDNAQEIQ